jgi:hypothetical protein
MHERVWIILILIYFWELWPFIPTRGFLGTAWEVVLVEAAYRVFRSTLQGLNQSIVCLSPLFETAYSTSHEIPNDGS